MSDKAGRRHCIVFCFQKPFRLGGSADVERMLRLLGVIFYGHRLGFPAANAASRVNNTATVSLIRVVRSNGTDGGRERKYTPELCILFSEMRSQIHGGVSGSTLACGACKSC